MSFSSLEYEPWHVAAPVGGQDAVDHRGEPGKKGRGGMATEGTWVQPA